MAPTNEPLPYFLQIDLSFDFYSKIESGSIVSVYLPQITKSNLETKLPEVVQDYPGQMVYFDVHWHGRNQTLDLIARVDISPGIKSFTVGSSEMVLVSGGEQPVMYDNQASYSVYQNGTRLFFGYFDAAESNGFTTSTLSFGSPSPDAVTSIYIGFVIESALVVGDKVAVNIPNLGNPNGQNSKIELSATFPSSVSEINEYFKIVWNPVSSSFVATAKASITGSVFFTIPESYGFTIPHLGINNVTGLPTISLRTNNWQFFDAAPFDIFVPIARPLESNLTFAYPAIAGQEATIHFEFKSSATGLGFKKYDVVELFLPSFWTPDESKVRAYENYSSTLGDFWVQWASCRESLRIQAKSDIDDAHSFAVNVYGMHIPFYGINSTLASYFSMSSNASNGNIASSALIQTQLVSYVQQANITFDPPAVAVNTSMTLSFIFSDNWYAYENVSIYLPSIVNANMSSEPSGLYKIDFKNASFVTAQWSADKSMLLLTPLRTFYGGETITVKMDSVVVSGRGFPLDTELPQVYAAGRELLLQGSGFTSIQYAGVRNAAIFYDVINDMQDEVALRFRFHPSGAIAAGDRITFQTPYVRSPLPAGTKVNASGDGADTAFVSAFDVFISANASTNTRSFDLVATSSDSSREINVFVSYGNSMFIDTSLAVQNYTHSISGSIASTGEFYSSGIEVSPKRFREVAVSDTIALSACAHGGSCAIQMAFQLRRAMKEGEIIAISHPNFVKSAPGVSLALASNGSDYFNGTWRTADDVNRLTVTSSEVSLLSGASSGAQSYARADANVIPRAANRTLRSTTLPQTIRIRTSVPRVLSLHARESPSALLCGDSLMLYLEFDEAVVVTDGSADKLRLLMSTREHAYYLDGSGSKTLRFAYNVKRAQPVSDLSPVGSGALEYDKLTCVLRAANPDQKVYANLTLPQPYGHLLRYKGGYSKIAVNCSDSVSVTDVTTHLGSDKSDYYTGDVLDVVVSFSRAVRVIGIPTITLRGHYGLDEYVASFVNVSAIQWLHSGLADIFLLSHGDESTVCMNGSDLARALRGNLMALSSLSLALPMEVEEFASADGFRYRLAFGGVSPPLLTLSNAQCGSGSSASISVDSSMYTKLTFRYEVGSEDVAYHLTYNSSSALAVDKDSFVYIAGHDRTDGADLRLPTPGQEGSLEVNRELNLLSQPPAVKRVSAAGSAGATLISGDAVDIYVHFTRSIVMTGYPVLELLFDSFIEGKYTNQTKFTRNVSMLSYNDSVIVFRYSVRVGDVASALSTESQHALHPNGSSILLASMQPSVAANLTLPAHDLRTASIAVASTQPPQIDSISTDHEPGIYGEGEEVVVTLTFSSPVYVTSASSVAPLIYLRAPEGAMMHYIGGSGSYDLHFIYTVAAGEQASALSFANANASWAVLLEGGYFTDLIGNTFYNVTTVPADISSFTAVAVDTAPAVILRVDSSSADGIYYPGGQVDLTVLFNKRVDVILSATGALPALALFVPYQDAVDMLAPYSSGNGTTALHFTYTIPAPGDERAALHPLMVLDYAGVNALSSNMAGAFIRDHTTNPTTDANVDLPTEDRSYIRYKRNLRLRFSVPRVTAATVTNDDGVYGVGDAVIINVAFSQPVMLTAYPPVLRLNVSTDSSSPRNAIFTSGNGTETLTFTYVIQEGDYSAGLDYVDTRYSPYGGPARRIQASLALSTDVRLTETGRLAQGEFRFNDIIFEASSYGGVYSHGEVAAVSANTALPLPGLVGSLSHGRAVVVDTRAPNVTKVYTTLPDGAYGEGVAVPIFVAYSSPVVVSGCPQIAFIVGDRLRYATYVSGSGSKILAFEYITQNSDYALEFDYRNTHALRLAQCGNNDEAAVSHMLRQSSSPSVSANLTLPFPKYVESVIAPTSILSSGNNITLTGRGARPTRIKVSATDGGAFAVGDFVELYIDFSAPVEASTSLNLALDGAASMARFARQLNDTTVMLRYIVQPSDSLALLTYTDNFSLLGETACSVADLTLSSGSTVCAAQDLPVRGSSADEFSSKKLSASSSSSTVTAVDFLYTDVSFGLDGAAGNAWGVPLSLGSCDPDGNSFFYREFVDIASGKRTIFTTTCPNHFSDCQATDCADLNRSSRALPAEKTYEVPLFPKFAASAKNVSCYDSSVGVALNGVALGSYSSSSSGCVAVVSTAALGQIDKCGGYADETDGLYRYQAPPSCLISQLEPLGNRSHGQQIGWAMDGFPIYSNRGPSGVAMGLCGSKTSTAEAPCLDSCRGFYGTLPTVDNFLYRYYAQADLAPDMQCSDVTINGAPTGSATCGGSCSVNKVPSAEPFLACFKGCLLDDVSCENRAAASGYSPAAASTVSTHATVVFDGTSATREVYLQSSTKRPEAFISSPLWDMQVAELLPNSTDRKIGVGSMLKVVVTFDRAVVVEGVPSINLQSDDSPQSYPFIEQLSPTQVVFGAPVTYSAGAGYRIRCLHDSSISLNGGRVLGAANFIPLLSADLRLGTACCADQCYVSSLVELTAPFVQRVYSQQDGYFTREDEIVLLVQFSAPVAVVGSPMLLLDLPGAPVASFVSRHASDTLLFRYVVGATDFASALDYANASALLISDGLYDGIVKAGVSTLVPANTTLPLRGAAGSLARESLITIDNACAFVVGLSSESSTVVSAGDSLTLTLVFSENVYLSNGCDGNVSLAAVVKASSGNAKVSRSLLLSGVSGSRATFTTTVRSSDPSGYLTVLDKLAVTAGDCTFKSAITNVVAQTAITSSLLDRELRTVDNAVPVVASISSPSVAQNGLGVGDVVDIYVELSLPVVVVEEPSLELQFSSGVRTAAFASPNATGGGITELHFRYSIEDGDYAFPLDYSGSYALSGLLLRYSDGSASGEALAADLSLPSPQTQGSLSYASPLTVDTARPFVTALFPLKKGGVYGQNELLVVVVRFSKPVTVAGAPTLLLRTGASSHGEATHLPSFSPRDLAADLSDSDVLFAYRVRLADNIASLCHYSADALRANNGSIKHKAANSSLAVHADLSLREPGDHVPIDNFVYRQWKSSYAQKVEVLLRGLYHGRASSLSAHVEHAGRRAQLFSGAAGKRTFGHKFSTAAGDRFAAGLKNADTAVGYNYFFSDTMLRNIALGAAATQSSTSQAASLAVDGNTDPLATRLSVSETQTEEDPWWQVQLPAGSSVRSVRVYPRKPQVFTPAVLTLTVRALDSHPRGGFSLQLCAFDISRYDYCANTGRVEMGADAVALKRALSTVEGIGEVAIERVALQPCDLLVDGTGGCGDGTELGYGYQYHVEFLGSQSARPTATFMNVSFRGSFLSQGVNNTYGNFEYQQLSLRSSVRRMGFSAEAPEVETYAPGVTPPDGAVTVASGYNAWLTPFWIMLFAADSPPPAALAAGLQQAYFKRKVESISDSLHVALPEATFAGFLKIQRVGSGSLSLAEVEVFEERVYTLGVYDGPAPVQPSPVTQPYQPEMPLQHRFLHAPVTGNWYLELSQDGSAPDTSGSLSDYVILVTDLAGVLHTHYQDLRAEVKSLPKYGQLFAMEAKSTSPYGNWRDAFDLSKTGELLPLAAGKRSKGACFNIIAANKNMSSQLDGYTSCVQSYGVAPELQSYVHGDMPEERFLYRERMVTYAPFKGYLGPDFFTYSIYDGVTLQQQSVSEITIHVRNCRLMEHKLSKGLLSSTSALCACSQTEDSMLGDSSCSAARTAACTDSSYRAQLYTMCIACAVNSTSTQECVRQTVRAVAALTSRGLCSTRPQMDCSSEVLTAPGLDRVSYLTLRQPVSEMEFTAVGNAMDNYRELGIASIY